MVTNHYFRLVISLGCIYGLSFDLSLSRADAGGAGSTNFKISSPKAFIFNFGTNRAQFWGAQDKPLPKDNPQRAGVVVSDSVTVVLADEGSNYGSDRNMYFVVAGRTKPSIAVSFADNTGYLMSFSGLHGQAISMGVRFFNATWEGHCQTFVAYGLTETDQDTAVSETTISLFYFDPGLVFKDGSSEEAPSFLLLKKYKSSDTSYDPDVVLSREYAIPLPNGYDESTPAGKPIPDENSTNTYRPEAVSDGCS